MELSKRFLKKIDEFINRRWIIILSTMVILVFLTTYAWTIFGGAGLLDRFGCVIGGDFIEFYTAGKIIDSGQTVHLYDFNLQRKIQTEIIFPQKTERFYEYVVVPFFAYLFVPLSKIPYLSSFFIWSVFSTILLAGSLLILKQHIPKLSKKDWILAGFVCFAHIPFSVECLAGGQTSALSLFILVLFYHLLKRQKDLLAGFVLAFGLFKPQLILVFPFCMAISGRWKTIISFFITAVLLIIISVSAIGLENISTYTEVLSDKTAFGELTGWKIWKMHSYCSFFKILFKRNIVLADTLSLLSIFVSLIFLTKIWLIKYYNTEQNFDLLFSVTVLFSLLINPHLYIYELTILILPVLLSLNFLFRMKLSSVEQAKFKIILVLLYITCIISDDVAKYVNLQLTVPMILIYALYLYKAMNSLGKKEQILVHI